MIFQLWSTKETAGEDLQPEEVVTLMRSWFDVHNLASDRSTPKEHKVFSVLSPGGDTSSCSVCGQSGHERSDCPLVKSKAQIFCKHHPELKNSHVTSACRNPATGANGPNETPGGPGGA